MTIERYDDFETLDAEERSVREQLALTVVDLSAIRMERRRLGKETKRLRHLSSLQQDDIAAKRQVGHFRWCPFKVAFCFQWYSMVSGFPGFGQLVLQLITYKVRDFW